MIKGDLLIFCCCVVVFIWYLHSLFVRRIIILDEGISLFHSTYLKSLSYVFSLYNLFGEQEHGWITGFSPYFALTGILVILINKPIVTHLYSVLYQVRNITDVFFLYTVIFCIIPSRNGRNTIRHYVRSNILPSSNF